MLGGHDNSHADKLLRQRKRVLPDVVPSFEICRDSIAIQFAVHKLSAALGSAARNDDAERVGSHEVNALQEAINERLRDSGNLHAAAHDGKDGLFGFLPVLVLLGFGVNGPLINGEGQSLFYVLYPLTFGFCQTVNSFLVVGVDVRTDDVHVVYLSGTVAVPALILYDAEICTGRYSPVNAYVSRETQALAR